MFLGDALTTVNQQARILMVAWLDEMQCSALMLNIVFMWQHIHLLLIQILDNSGPCLPSTRQQKGLRRITVAV